MVFLISLLQAFSQIISVAAVFPFLALAAEPDKFDQSGVGRWLLFLLPGKSYEQLLAVTGFGLIAAFFFGNGASMYGEFYRARFTWGFAHWLRMRMLDRMNARPYSWFLRQNSSVLIKKTPVSENENLYPMARQTDEKRLRLANPHSIQLNVVVQFPQKSRLRRILSCLA